MDDAALAAGIAEEAGRMLRAFRAAGDLTGAALGAAADRAANALILDRLRAARPDDSILSEESPDHLSRLAARRVWIVDPLDGTRDYEAGSDEWAVHIALAIDGCPAIGAVAVPALGRLYRSDQVAPPPPRPRPPVMLVSRSRAPAETDRLAQAIGATVREMGSAGAKAMAVVAGEADLYYHNGGQHEWDNCAPAAVALAAGLHVSRPDGSPLRYNQADTLVPGLIIGVTEAAAAAVRICSGSTSSRK
jgi:3'(2'), 5'-bisphosphate nucleotidase